MNKWRFSQLQIYLFTYIAVNRILLQRLVWTNKLQQEHIETEHYTHRSNTIVGVATGGGRRRAFLLG